MADNKKTTNEEIKNKELSDEQANDAAGGSGLNYYTCCGCKRTFFGRPFKSGGRTYCAKCLPKVSII